MIEYSILDFYQGRIACFSPAISLGLEGEGTFVFVNGQLLFVCLFLSLFGRKVVAGWGGQTGNSILLHLNANVPEA